MKQMTQNLRWLVTLLAMIVSVGAWAEDVTQTVSLSEGSYSSRTITWRTNDDAIAIQQSCGSSTTNVYTNNISTPRVYKGHILSFIASNGAKIKRIAITYADEYYGNSMTSGTELDGRNVIDNPTFVTRTWDTTSGGTHVLSSVNEDGLSEIYIQNVADNIKVELRPTAISVTYSQGIQTNTQTSRLVFNSLCGGSGTANDEVSWTVTSDAPENSYERIRGIQYGSGSSAVSYLTLTTSGISGTIKSIVVNTSGASNTSAKVSVTVGGNSFGGNPQSITSDATDYTFNGSASGTIVVTVSQTSAKKALYVKSITVTYEPQQSTPTPITEIKNFDDLKSFRESVNSGADYTDKTVTLTDNISVSVWDTPIGVYGYKEATATPDGTNILYYVEDETKSHPFNGTFDGNGKTITLGSGSAEVKRGLFGYVKNATIKNLNLVAYIKDEENNSRSTSHDQTTNIDATEDYSFGFGGIAHMANSSSFAGCTVTGKIEFPNSNNVGGVVGRIQGSEDSDITSCNVDVTTLNGHRMTGGVVGGIFGDGVVKISDCSTAGVVQGNVCTGGIVGNSENTNENGITIEKCFNKAQVGTNNSFKGGIIAHCYKGTITRCYNCGSVSAGGSSDVETVSYSGGIVGRIESGTVSYCYNTGTVSSKKVAGGIVGHAVSIALQSVYNTGTIIADDFTSLGSGSVFGSLGEGSTCNAAFYHNNAKFGNVEGCTGLTDDEINGWGLYGASSSTDKKIGYGAASDLNPRYWVFVNQNTPLLYEVRGQVVHLKGTPAKHYGGEGLALYTSFSSDVKFSTGTNTSAWWVQKDEGDGDVFFDAHSDQYGVQSIIVSHQTSILYPFNSSNQQLGYIIQSAGTETSSGTGSSSLRLQYRTEKENIANDYDKYGMATQMHGTDYDWVYKADPWKDMYGTTIKEGNALYGVDVRTPSADLKGDGCIYGFGVKNGEAIFANYIGQALPNNKAYLKVSSAQNAKFVSRNKSYVSIFNPIVEPSKVLLGDVDVDGSVTISDVVKVVNAIISDVYDDDVMEYGDVNGDGELDVADVVGIVNTVLDIRYDDVKARKVSSAVNGGNEASLEQNDGVVDFLLNNSNAFCAFQFYMNAEDGLDCEKVTLSARAKGHFVSMNKLSDGRYKVMCYSGGNNTFTGNEGELFNILISGASGKLTLENLFFVTPGASKVKFGNLDIDVVPTGINSIDADANANAIFDLSGRRVQQPQKGVYIVNGKKIMY